ncbi:MurR/RpiR family transcriptional regulator [Aerococcus sp. UMB1112A]|uniref:MurR/RpiR family transcriptional regulator n=1 Tax=Aerococcus sp. UMB1112A TaxID=3050609 RepID=UPI00254CFB20|nr:MurR/RpiR family transcriptional regulator [Aerococcus sp. UMB1112A]MDK8502433.1 MurR/RpiR family transcriptional regulator [Aerococcus sp. UMB1112A]
MDVLMKIQKEYLNLASKEKKVADYILRYSDSIKNMNIKELAEKTGTSPSTITRFIRKIDLISYSDMKIDLQSADSQKIPEYTDSIIDDVFLYYQNVIKNTQRLINIQEIEAFADMISDAPKVILIGASNSGVTADIFRVRLMRMGIEAISYSDPMWMEMNAGISNANDLYIVLSNSGTTQCIIDTMKRAKLRGCKIISITSYSENPIGEMSDLALYVYNTRFVNNEKFTNSQFSMVYLIDVLTTYLLENDNYRLKMLRTRDIVGDA